MKLDAELQRKVSASVLRITERSAFFATLALYARFEASQHIPTAATDGRTIFVNPEFWNKLTVGEQDGVLLHEVLHAALLHVTRRAGRHAEIWNAAADIVINGMIAQEGYQLPEGGLRDEFIERLSTEEVYEVLLKKHQPPPPVPMSDLLDESPGDSSSSQGQAGKEQAGAEQKSGAPKPGEGAGKESKEALEGHWRNALEQAQMAAKTLAAGKMPAGILREMPSVIAAQLDWRTYLWRYLTQTPTDFQDFDRRFVGQRVYLDSLTGESVQVLVCVDTSGSVGNAEMQIFLSEVREILRAYPHLRCELFYADAALYGPYSLKFNSAIPPPQGGGGTDFRPFFDHIATHPFLWGKTVAIYLTDGYGSFPEERLPKCPVLWVVTPGGLDLDRFPFGEAIRLLRSQPTPFAAAR
ncbi:MAG: VWA-like domain-containing protein [Anaerolineales bacterium]|nr:VWA-like domain-containing protein [Anaerolineales bacterium]